MLTLDRNVGKDEAVRRGLLRAMGSGPDLVGFWDADLATPLDLVDDFRVVLHQQPRRAWVLGSRWRGLGRQIERNAVRHYLSRIFATAVSAALRLPVYDTQCGAKVFRANSLLAEVLGEPFESRWVFDVEMLARLVAAHRQGRAPALGDLACELPLTRWQHDGRSHVQASDFVVAVRDIGRIWWPYLR